ncbi:MAG: YihY/virulence factor BrkB family protein [Oscillospiraceae bacterium]|nr:YihY/virulence factor BrkB family protein [Oscillospiraceae bacterium]
MFKKLQKPYEQIAAFFRGLSMRNVTVYASSSAFYIFLSIVPFIMLIGSLLPITRLESHELSEFVSIIVPDTIADFLDSIIREVYAYSPAILSISAVTTLWSASKAMMSIMRGIEHVSDDTRKDKYIHLRLKAILYSVTVLLAIYILIMATMFLNFLTSLKIISAGFIKIISPFILALILAVAYRFIPDKKVPFRDLLPGACIAAICWTIFTAGYSWWLNSSNSYGIYGSLGSVIITLLWLYFTMYIMLTGAYLNRYITDRKTSRKRPVE